MQEDLGKCVEWFERHGVTAWNLSTLAPLADGRRKMIGDKCIRARVKVEKTARWAWYRNCEGADIYMRPATGPAWPIVFLDDLPPENAVKLSEKYACLVIETSHNNCQVWIAATQPLTIAERALVQRTLAAGAGSDMASISGDHFGRAAGYINHKSGRNSFLVRFSRHREHPFQTIVNRVYERS